MDGQLATLLLPPCTVRRELQPQPCLSEPDFVTPEGRHASLTSLQPHVQQLLVFALASRGAGLRYRPRVALCKRHGEVGSVVRVQCAWSRLRSGSLQVLAVCMRSRRQ